MEKKVFTEEGEKIIADTIRSKAEQLRTNKTNEPLGRCNISVWTSKTCVDDVTLKQCAQLGVEAGGVSSWDEGEKCPK